MDRVDIGIYARIIRDGQPQTVALVDMTTPEIHAYYAGRPELTIRTLLRVLRWIRENVIAIPEEGADDDRP